MLSLGKCQSWSPTGSTETVSWPDKADEYIWVCGEKRVLRVAL